MGFPRQEYWSGLPFPPPGDLPDPGSNSSLVCLLHWQADSLPLHHQGSPYILCSGKCFRRRKAANKGWLSYNYHYGHGLMPQRKNSWPRIIPLKGWGSWYIKIPTAEFEDCSQGRVAYSSLGNKCPQAQRQSLVVESHLGKHIYPKLVDWGMPAFAPGSKAWGLRHLYPVKLLPSLSHGSSSAHPPSPPGAPLGSRKPLSLLRVTSRDYVVPNK